jgi:adenylyltransferase/sulfurtransferase
MSAATRPSAEATAAPMSGAELARYRRQITLPEVGVEGQEKLRAARVLVVGTGGLGSPVALYLAAAGVGTLGLVDFDRVDATNLHRQVVHGTASVGVKKVDSASERLHDLNPHVRIRTHDVALTASNALEIVGQYDLVVDGTDNFPTRYLLSDACVLLGKPNVYGSVQRFEGQASIFCTPTGPCYRCLFREPPPPGMVPSCAEAGVFGVMPGLVGMIQATETIKWILGLGTTLDGRLMLIDAMKMATRTIALRRDPECPACGTRTITQLVDYEAFCGVRHDGSPLEAAMLPDELTPREAAERIAAGAFLLDVREPFEAEIAAIAGATLVPMRTVPARLAEIPRDRDVIVHCHHGMRSRSVADFLKAQGYTRIANLSGGIDRWSQDVDPSVPSY